MTLLDWAYASGLSIIGRDWYKRRLDAQEAAGSWAFEHFRQRCRDAGVETASLQLRKQGWPVDVVRQMVRAL